MKYFPAPLPLHNIPEEFIASVAARVNNRTVALVRCRQYKNGYQEALHIGSGTLVNYNSVYGVLTAYHVVEKLEGPCHIGLDIGNLPHAFLIDKDFTQIVSIAKPESDVLGPDLAFIGLPEADVETIKSSAMAFHPISQDIRAHKEMQEVPNSGLWFLCGVPAQRTVEAGPWAHYKRVYIYFNITR